ncbi:hypothetical protein [Sanguibacter sp. Z1732]|uniref:hypothetical protein n=1 Tax=Sanguibacter sp. Z1732 TaxID=3435412 RepID=UPI003D9C85C5
MTAPQILTLADLLNLIHTPGEHTSINHQGPRQQFTSRILPSTTAGAYAATLQNVNIWYGVNPIRPSATGRGKAEDITRLAALYVDLDIKPDGLDSFETARAVINDLSTMLGTRPTAIVNSGNGLQPIWATDPDDPALTDHTTTTALLRRFGRLVTTVAAAHGGQADHVFDLPRILRAPGTTNHKNPAQPVPVVAVTDTGYPLDAATITTPSWATASPNNPKTKSNSAKPSPHQPPGNTPNTPAYTHRKWSPAGPPTHPPPATPGSSRKPPASPPYTASAASPKKTTTKPPKPSETASGTS